MSSDSSSQGGSPSVGSPCWIQLPAKDMSRAKSFYSAVFDWTFTPVGEIDMIHFSDPNFKSLGGNIYKSDEVVHAKYGETPAIYFSTKAIGEALEKVEKAGGTVVRGQEPVGGGYTASFRDTEGNVEGIFAMIE